MAKKKRIAIGSAKARPGSIQYGAFEAFSHPTGGLEKIPVVIAAGEEDGPCFWLTSGIHGPEHTGPLILYHLLTEELLAGLKGTIVVIPALNPAGLRTQSREPYHAPGDPNRLWPDGKPQPEPGPDKEPPSSLEIAYQRLFDLMLETADYLIDFHNAWIGSIPFVFRDRVLFMEDPEKNKGRGEAEKLSSFQDAMIKAFGFSAINEYPVEKYLELKLHRSTSGAALLVGRIPAFTVELGTGLMPDPRVRAAAEAGTRNVLRWAGMLPGAAEVVDGIPKPDPGYPVRRRAAPRTSSACVVEHLVEPGDEFQAGDLLARAMDIWGRPLEEQALTAPEDGYVIGRAHGIYYYPGQAVAHLAVRDETPLVEPYPEDFFKE